MRETQSSIAEWAEETFGPATSLVRILARANEEMAELLRAVTAGLTPAVIAVEAADTAIVLCRAAQKIETAVSFKSTGLSAIVPLRAATHANRALADLIIEASRPRGFDRAFAAGLLARIFLFLRRLCEALGHSLDVEIDAKMEINRARQWRLDGSGHGYHVRDAVPAAVHV